MLYYFFTVILTIFFGLFNLFHNLINELCKIYGVFGCDNRLSRFCFQSLPCNPRYPSATTGYALIFFKGSRLFLFGYVGGGSLCKHIQDKLCRTHVVTQILFF